MARRRRKIFRATITGVPSREGEIPEEMVTLASTRGGGVREGGSGSGGETPPPATTIPLPWRHR